MVSSRPRIPRILKIYTQVLQFAQENILKNRFATALLFSFMDWISLNCGHLKAFFLIILCNDNDLIRARNGFACTNAETSNVLS